MSDIFSAIAETTGSLIDGAFALITPAGQRSIGGIIPHVTVEEVHHDDMAITDHPVETGATISDHAFKVPVQVEMRVGFSNSSASQEGFVKLVYQELLALQSSREPFDLYTGKRAYQNMLISSLTVTTDARSEYALNVVALIREVIITNTSSTAGSQSGSTAAPAADQSSQGAPQQTSGTDRTGYNTLQFNGAAPSSAQLFDPNGPFAYGAGGSPTSLQTSTGFGTFTPSVAAIPPNGSLNGVNLRG